MAIIKLKLEVQTKEYQGSKFEVFKSNYKNGAAIDVRFTRGLSVPTVNGYLWIDTDKTGKESCFITRAENKEGVASKYEHLQVGNIFKFEPDVTVKVEHKPVGNNVAYLFGE